MLKVPCYGVGGCKSSRRLEGRARRPLVTSNAGQRSSATAILPEFLRSRQALSLVAVVVEVRLGGAEPCLRPLRGARRVRHRHGVECLSDLEVYDVIRRSNVLPLLAGLAVLGSCKIYFL
jgi:hypothetical protein